MKLLDLTLPTPAENLACDEVLLDWAEASGDEVLRFWESREYFVVVGYANRVGTEVNVAACAIRQTPIFRRCSGGGTVLQGQGCLNYTLVLQIARHSPLANISSTNQFVMGQNCKAVQSAIGHRPSAISIRGHTDLALVTRHSPPVTPKKFSGNSQRRHKNALLFHGTFLLHFDLALVNELLRMPSKQPDYRDHRGHGDFLSNLNIPAERLKSALARIWNANEKMHDLPGNELPKLAAEKYSTAKWNFKL
jgi:lipoate-protein ligase A